MHYLLLNQSRGPSDPQAECGWLPSEIVPLKLVAKFRKREGQMRS